MLDVDVQKYLLHFIDSFIITPSSDSDERFKMQFVFCQLETNKKLIEEEACKVCGLFFSYSELMEYDGRAPASIKLYSVYEVATEIDGTSSHHIGHVSPRVNRRESDLKSSSWNIFLLSPREGHQLSRSIHHGE